MKKWNFRFAIMFFIIMIISSPKIYAQDWAGLNTFKEANASLKPPSKNENRVVFMGNSITDYWKELDPSFFEDNPYINRGIGGQTTPQMLVRFQADVIHLQPAVVVILGGTNDIAGNTGPSSLEMIEDNIAAMAELAEINNIKVVLCSVTPVYRYPWSPEIRPVKKIKVLNRWIKKFSKDRGYVYCNYYSALVDNKGGMKEKYAKDGVHPTKLGYQVMESLVMKSIKKAIHGG